MGFNLGGQRVPFQAQAFNEGSADALPVRTGLRGKVGGEGARCARELRWQHHRINRA